MQLRELVGPNNEEFAFGNHKQVRPNVPNNQELTLHAPAK